MVLNITSSLMQKAPLFCGTVLHRPSPSCPLSLVAYGGGGGSSKSGITNGITIARVTRRGNDTMETVCQILTDAEIATAIDGVAVEGGKGAGLNLLVAASVGKDIVLHLLEVTTPAKGSDKIETTLTKLGQVNYGSPCGANCLKLFKAGDGSSSSSSPSSGVLLAACGDDGRYVVVRLSVALGPVPSVRETGRVEQDLSPADPEIKAPAAAEPSARTPSAAEPEPKVPLNSLCFIPHGDKSSGSQNLSLLVCGTSAFLFSLTNLAYGALTSSLLQSFAPVLPPVLAAEAASREAAPTKSRFGPPPRRRPNILAIKSSALCPATGGVAYLLVSGRSGSGYVFRYRIAGVRTGSIALSSGAGEYGVDAVSPLCPAKCLCAMGVDGKGAEGGGGGKTVLAVASVNGDVSAWMDFGGAGNFAAEANALHRIGKSYWGKDTGVLKGLHDMPITTIVAAPDRRVTSFDGGGAEVVNGELVFDIMTCGGEGRVTTLDVYERSGKAMKKGSAGAGSSSFFAIWVVLLALFLVLLVGASIALYVENGGECMRRFRTEDGFFKLGKYGEFGECVAKVALKNAKKRGFEF